MRCTHGCSHYHPELPPKDGRCDIHQWAWPFMDRYNCTGFDGRPYKEKEPKPKKIKQPQGAWQTGLAVYQGFPYCCQSFQDHADSHVELGADLEVAFYCDNYTQHKASAIECLGMECPHCKLVQIQEYNKHIMDALKPGIIDVPGRDKGFYVPKP